MFEQSLSLFKQADQARVYIATTTAHGPSQQLLDFINYDKTIGKEIGLESFETFSTGTQHEILLSKLNPDQLDQLGMEGFRDGVKKYRKWLLAAAGAAWFLRGGWLPLILAGAGIAGVAMKHQEDKVAPYSDMVAALKTLDTDLKSLREVVSKLPSKSDGGEKWASYANNCKDVAEKNDSFVEFESERKSFNKSGWTVTNIVEALKKFESDGNEYADLRKSFNDKMGPLESADEEVAKHASPAMSASRKAFDSTGSLIRAIKSEFDTVSKCYEAKKKD